MGEETVDIDPGGQRSTHQVRLTVVAGPHSGQKWVFDRNVRLVVGRTSPSHLVFADEKAFSGRHAQIEINPPSVQVRDLESRNGLYVNGVRLVEATLSDGDRFGVGDTEILVESESSVQHRSPQPVDGDERRPSVKRDRQEAGDDIAPRDSDADAGPVSNPVGQHRPPTEMSGPEHDNVRPTFAQTRHQGMEGFAKHVTGNPPRRLTSDPFSPTTAQSTPGKRTDVGDLGDSNQGDSGFSASDEIDDDDKVPRFAIGQSIGAYELKALIGRGGMASVYRATHRRSDKVFAIKLIRTDLTETEKRVQMFVREATVLTQLRHPRIVDAVELGIHHRSPYLVMEYVDNLDLLKLIDSQKSKQRVKTSIWVISRVLEALHYLHGEGIVHRDIKPGNVLAYKEGHRLQVKLADFGLAKLFADSGLSGLTSEKSVRGTLAYMSPEHFRRSVDAQPPDDLFSCGATLFRLLTGQLPNMLFQPNETLEVLRTHPLPKSLRKMVAKSIDLDPAKRFQTVAEFAEVIKTITL